MRDEKATAVLGGGTGAPPRRERVAGRKHHLYARADICRGTRPGVARPDQGDLFTEIFRAAYEYAEAARAAEAAYRDRELARFIRRLAAHFPGFEPAIVCVAETMSELEMGHFTREEFGMAADPHLVGVIDE